MIAITSYIDILYSDYVGCFGRQFVSKLSIQKNVCGSTIDSIVLRIDSISPMFESIAIYWSIESIL